jgi:hypothetical protein
VEKAAVGLAAVQEMKAAEFAVALLIPSPLVFSDLIPFEAFSSLFSNLSGPAFPLFCSTFPSFYSVF